MKPNLHNYNRREFDTRNYEATECVACARELFKGDTIHEVYPDVYCDDCVPRCQLENDCGHVRVAGGEGGCTVHEIALWLSELRETSDSLKRMEILTRLVDLGYVAGVAA